ncbi:ATP-dependent DNA helicase [Tautonia sociabilis]|uniref:DNA 5'-3' helicase n=1 Tax=Tautonia sociabilis TaxID=2080755 RepID=A0A432MS48_9BACT|nr:helicase C-terminal domain-containing protein [Tautonia sociabilis]RUL89718.1 DEAD/DEAH box helicase [Tautonia sociabilis]
MTELDFDPSPILGPGGAVSRRLPRYEPRAEQLEMARAVARAIVEGSHLVVEAGTGVGKSFAYLVPSILAASEAGKKVVVSTHTISLQEQLLHKDLPFLRAVMPCEFTASLVKGRSNYISLRRLESAGARALATFQHPDEFDHYHALRSWAKETDDGSRSDLDFRPAAAVWDAVASENGNCLGKRCPRFNDCFYFKARRRMRTANILVVNHALFFSDLALRAEGFGLLPDYDVVVFDEAHTLEAVAGDHLGLRITSGQVDYLLTRLYNERSRKGLLAHFDLDEAIDATRPARIAASAFFGEIARWRESDGRPNGRLRSPIGLQTELPEALRRLGSSILEGAKEIEDEGQRLELTAAGDRCDLTAEMIDRWLQQSEPDGVYWVDLEGSPSRRRTVLAAAPIEVGPVLNRLLWQEGPTCILASATLCSGSPPDTRFVRGRLGLSGGQSLQLGSPFAYREQARLHIARGMPDPSEDADGFERACLKAIPHYVELTGGRAFVLFTSYRFLEAASRLLLPWFVDRGIPLVSQSDGLPRSKMVESFRSRPGSVLFGLDSFWQGVDVPGEALSNVIITKLPFSVPDRPLLEARLEAIRRRGGNPFVEHQVPEAVLKLKQGFGRLIRSREDRGIVVILDPRVLTKPYGRTFLDALPDCPRSIDSARFDGPAR